MNTAERWAGDRKFSSVALTSSVSRSGAHSFYNEMGYKVISFMQKELGEPATAGLKTHKAGRANAGCGERRERITRALDGDFAYDAAPAAGAFGRTPPVSP